MHKEYKITYINRFGEETCRFTFANSKPEAIKKWETSLYSENASLISCDLYKEYSE